MVASRTGERIVPDAFAQPASVTAFAVISAISWQRHNAGSNTWKGRSVVVMGDPGVASTHE